MMGGGIVAGDLTVVASGEVRDMIGGTLTVADGADVLISGMVGGDLVVSEGCRARITGMVGGRVINRGGTVGIDGLIGYGHIGP